jgi:hypothetical protein
MYPYERFFLQISLLKDCAICIKYFVVFMWYIYRRLYEILIQSCSSEALKRRSSGLSVSRLDINEN